MEAKDEVEEEEMNKYKEAVKKVGERDFNKIAEELGVSYSYVDYLTEVYEVVLDCLKL